MIKRVVSYWLLVVSLAAAETFVHPTRTDYGVVVPNVSMPVSLWTNCVFALSAEIPVVNSGLTNALWLDWSAARGAAKQTGTGYQPVRTNLGGVECYGFDGIDDLISTGSTAISTNPFTLSVWAFPFVSNVEQAALGEGEAHGGGSTRAMLGISQYAGTRWRLTGYTESGSLFQPISSSPVLTGVWSHVVGVWDGATMYVVVNGVFGAVSNVPSIRTTGAFNLSLGNGPNRSRGFNGYLTQPEVFNRPLTSNEIIQLYNLGKWRRGE